MIIYYVWFGESCNQSGISILHYSQPANITVDITYLFLFIWLKQVSKLYFAQIK